MTVIRWWMGTGGAGCSAPDEGKKKAAHSRARPGVLHDACGLRAQTIEHGRNGDRMVCRGHFGSGLCAVGCYGFPFGVPAAVERIEVGLLTCGFMSCPPVFELLVRALCSSGAADTDMRSPYGGMSIRLYQGLWYTISQRLHIDEGRCRGLATRKSPSVLGVYAR